MIGHCRAPAFLSLFHRPTIIWVFVSFILLKIRCLNPSPATMRAHRSHHQSYYQSYIILSVILSVIYHNINHIINHIISHIISLIITCLYITCLCNPRPPRNSLLLIFLRLPMADTPSDFNFLFSKLRTTPVSSCNYAALASQPVYCRQLTALRHSVPFTSWRFFMQMMPLLAASRSDLMSRAS